LALSSHQSYKQKIKRLFSENGKESFLNQKAQVKEYKRWQIKIRNVII